MRELAARQAEMRERVQAQQELLFGAEPIILPSNPRLEPVLNQGKDFPRVDGRLGSVPGFVYLMIDDNTGCFKIGYSKNPSFREKTLQSEKPTIRLLAFWAGTRDDEKSLHGRFEAKRVRGEWFRLTDDDCRSLGVEVSAHCGPKPMGRLDKKPSIAQALASYFYLRKRREDEEARTKAVEAGVDPAALER